MHCLRLHKFWFCTVAMAILAASILFPAQVQPAAPCCDITGINLRTGVVTAKVNATGQTFQFAVTNKAQLRGLRVGSGVYADFANHQVSLDGRTTAGSIVSMAAAPVAPASNSKVSVNSVPPITGATAGTKPAAPSSAPTAQGNKVLADWQRFASDHNLQTHSAHIARGTSVQLGSLQAVAEGEGRFITIPNNGECPEKVEGGGTQCILTHQDKAYCDYFCVDIPTRGGDGSGGQNVSGGSPQPLSSPAPGSATTGSASSNTKGANPMLQTAAGGIHPLQGNFSCDGVNCTCWGDDDCNNMFTAGVCKDNGVCQGRVVTCQCHQHSALGAGEPHFAAPAGTRLTVESIEGSRMTARQSGGTGGTVHMQLSPPMASTLKPGDELVVRGPTAGVGGSSDDKVSQEFRGFGGSDPIPIAFTANLAIDFKKPGEPKSCPATILINGRECTLANSTVQNGILWCNYNCPPPQKNGPE